MVDRACPGKQREVIEALRINPSAAINAAREVRRQVRLGTLTDATAPPLKGMGRFAVLYADPPWPHDWPISDSRDVTLNHYPTMSIDEIMHLPIGEIGTMMRHCFYGALRRRLPMVCA